MTAYAAPSDLVARFGEAELIRLTTDEGQDFGTFDLVRVTAAIGDASAIIDSYLRRRYLTPLALVPQEILRATCVLARHALAQGGGREPTTQMENGRKDVLAWLEQLRDGTALLDESVVATSPESYAQMTSRGVANGADPVVSDNVPSDEAYFGPAQQFWGVSP